MNMPTTATAVKTTEATTRTMATMPTWAVMFPSRADPSSEPFSAEDRAHVNIDLGSCAEPEFVNA